MQNSRLTSDTAFKRAVWIVKGRERGRRTPKSCKQNFYLVVCG
jgi:hypothetical protein